MGILGICAFSQTGLQITGFNPVSQPRVGGTDLPRSCRQDQIPALGLWLFPLANRQMASKNKCPVFSNIFPFNHKPLCPDISKNITSKPFQTKRDVRHEVLGLVTTTTPWGSDVCEPSARSDPTATKTHAETTRDGPYNSNQVDIKVKPQPKENGGLDPALRNSL